MKKLISCRLNMDTACVELKFSDGSMIAIDTIAVENEVADNMYQRSELDWLIYQWPRSESEVRSLTPQQYRWLMEGLQIEQPKAHRPVTGLTVL